jgi:hypothetical protein
VVTMCNAGEQLVCRLAAGGTGAHWWS